MVVMATEPSYLKQSPGFMVDSAVVPEAEPWLHSGHGGQSGRNLKQSPGFMVVMGDRAVGI